MVVVSSKKIEPAKFDKKKEKSLKICIAEKLDKMNFFAIFLLWSQICSQKQSTSLYYLLIQNCLPVSSPFHLGCYSCKVNINIYAFFQLLTFVDFLMFHHSSLVILLFCYFGYTSRKLKNNDRHFCNEAGRCLSSTLRQITVAAIQIKHFLCIKHQVCARKRLTLTSWSYFYSRDVKWGIPKPP